MKITPLKIPGSFSIALDARGEFWLVANRHLPYEATLARRFGAVRSVAEHGGFKVIVATQVRA